MPSPFPGMDPYIENQAWPDFQHRLITRVADVILPRLRPRYIVRAEERVYLEHDPEGRRDHIRPDLLVARASGVHATPATRTSTATLSEPLEVSLPVPERVREYYLTIADRETREVVTILEVLSPANKRPGSDGRKEYLSKRDEVLMSQTSLVEIDLLRGGDRLPIDQELPRADYVKLVSRGSRRPYADAYCASVRQPLPAIRIPLARHDDAVPLDVQAAVTWVYDSAGYDYSLDYSAPIEPPLSEADAAWAREVLNARA